jgi:hypothetical protein
MPRDGAIIFGDLIGKLVACDKCGRKGRYTVARQIERRGYGNGYGPKEPPAFHRRPGILVKY